MLDNYHWKVRKLENRTQRGVVLTIASNSFSSSLFSSTHIELFRLSSSFFSFFFSSLVFSIILQCSSFSALSFIYIWHWSSKTLDNCMNLQITDKSSFPTSVPIEWNARNDKKTRTLGKLFPNNQIVTILLGK